MIKHEHLFCCTCTHTSARNYVEVYRNLVNHAAEASSSLLKPCFLGLQGLSTLSKPIIAFNTEVGTLKQQVCYHSYPAINNHNFHGNTLHTSYDDTRLYVQWRLSCPGDWTSPRLNRPPKMQSHHCRGWWKAPAHQRRAVSSSSGTKEQGVKQTTDP